MMMKDALRDTAATCRGSLNAHSLSLTPMYSKLG